METSASGAGHPCQRHRPGRRRNIGACPPQSEPAPLRTATVHRPGDPAARLPAPTHTGASPRGSQDRAEAHAGHRAGPQESPAPARQRNRGDERRGRFGARHRTGATVARPVRPAPPFRSVPRLFPWIPRQAGPVLASALSSARRAQGRGPRGAVARTTPLAKKAPGGWSSCRLEVDPGSAHRRCRESAAPGETRSEGSLTPPAGRIRAGFIPPRRPARRRTRPFPPREGMPAPRVASSARGLSGWWTPGSSRWNR